MEYVLLWHLQYITWIQYSFLLSLPFDHAVAAFRVQRDIALGALTIIVSKPGKRIGVSLCLASSFCLGCGSFSFSFFLVLPGFGCSLYSILNIF
jgi:hypothetical protein